VRLERIVLVEDRSDSALGLPGVGVFQAAFADDDNVASFGHLQRRPQARQARAYDDAIGEKLVRRHRIDVNQVLNPLAVRRAADLVLLIHFLPASQ